MSEPRDLSRRNFLAGSVAATAFVAAVGSRAYAAGLDTLKIGLVGCGGRGSGAIVNALDAAAQAKVSAKLVALGDLFEDKLNAGRETYAKQLGARADLPAERCFSGFDAYKQVVDSDVNYVLFATPPGFRPLHIRYAIEKGRHVFFEKPCAVDPAGARHVIETGKLAAEKKLGLVAGTLYRHAPCYRETVQRIHDGYMGSITAGQVYYNTGELWLRERTDKMTEAEWQCRNWYYFPWLSGDFNVEQHVHNLDVMHWVMGGPPLRCIAMGGRQKRTEPSYGTIFDHIATDYEWPDGVHIMSMCRQQNGTEPKNTNHYIGTAGHSDPSNWIRGANPYSYQNPKPFDGYLLEHYDFIMSLLAGEPLNEARQQAESSLIGIMARMAAYTGKEVTWDFVMNKSRLDLWPAEWKDGPKFGPMATPPVPIPGRTPLI